VGGISPTVQGVEAANARRTGLAVDGGELAETVDGREFGQRYDDAVGMGAEHLDAALGKHVKAMGLIARRICANEDGWRETESGGAAQRCDQGKCHVHPARRSQEGGSHPGSADARPRLISFFNGVGNTADWYCWDRSRARPRG
jgi:hypothetical protein